MLIKCPECELQVSDKAYICPHCGYPLKGSNKTQARKSNKRKRLPNGFGQISEIKGRNLRKPFRAMVTVGKYDNGRPIVKPLKPESYFETYNDAYVALLEYNRNPYDLEPDITVSQLYEEWTEYYFNTLKSESSKRTIISAWKYCSSVYNMRAKDIRARHVKGCMDEGFAIIRGEKRYPTSGVKSRIKSLFNLMLDYAVEYEITDRNYARTFDISDEIISETNEAKRSHIPFTDDEMQKLWDNLNTVSYVDVILIQCYSGWRPQELGLIKLEDVDLSNHTYKGGMKTEAGKNRIVPIHDKVYDLVKNRYEQALELGSEYLINCTDSKTHTKTKLKFTYDKYRQRFVKIVNHLELNPDHRAHDGRKHFVTMAKKYNLDEYAIKYIVGHTINDITEKVYTERDIEWLKEEMQKIK